MEPQHPSLVRCWGVFVYLNHSLESLMLNGLWFLNLAHITIEPNFTFVLHGRPDARGCPIDYLLGFFFSLIGYLLVLPKQIQIKYCIVKSQLILLASIISFCLVVYRKVPNECLSFLSSCGRNLLAYRLIRLLYYV